MNEDFKDLKDTVDYMLSDDYKERFIAEYKQLRIRRTKLANMVCKIKNGTIDFVPSCSIHIYQAQISAMDTYLTILDYRAIVENIDLSEVSNANS